MNFRMRTSRRWRSCRRWRERAANLFVVGDPDQAIYQFRGASSEAFYLFRRKFPKREVKPGEKPPLALA